MEALYVWRRASGLTMNEIQLRVPPSPNGKMVPHAQWIRGEARGTIPRYRNLKRYCTALNVTLAELFGMQAVIEELIIESLFDVKSSWEVAITAFSKQRKLRVAKLLKRKPGPILFEVRRK